MDRATKNGTLLDRAVLLCAIAGYLGILAGLNWPYLSANAFQKFGGAEQEICIWTLCFAPGVKSDTPRIFGFAEFISALALLVIVYTVVDVRYRFRIAIAPSPLYRLTFSLIGVIGAESLLTEIWLAEGWWLPRASFMTRAIWQGIFGALFLGMFLTWIWYAFIRPPVYDSRNAKRYFGALYRLIVRGTEGDLAVLADELRRSANSLVKHCPSVPQEMRSASNPFKDLKPVQGYAYDVLQLIANRKFCRSIVLTAPTTAIAIFDAAARDKKYDLPLGVFAKNISGEAIGNVDSNLYHEDHPSSGGLLGYVRPFSQAIYGDYFLVEGLGATSGSPLDIDFLEQYRWSAIEWTAYSRVTLITLKAYLLTTEGNRRSYVLNRAFDDFESAFRDFYKLDKLDPPTLYETDSFKRFEAAVDFAKEAVNALGTGPRPLPAKLRLRAGEFGSDIYDRLTDLMFKAVAASAKITGRSFATWHIQYSSTWTQFFELETSDQAWKIVQFKLRRKLYNEIVELSSHSNYQSASILGLCLSVFGLRSGPQTPRSYLALAKALVSWSRREYPKLLQRDPQLAAAVLIGSISYDLKRHALVKTYEGPGAATLLPLDGEPSSDGKPSQARRVKVHTDKRRIRAER